MINKLIKEGFTKEEASYIVNILSEAKPKKMKFHWENPKFNISVEGEKGYVRGEVDVVGKPTLQDLESFKSNIHDLLMNEWKPSRMGTTFEIVFKNLSEEGIEFFKDKSNSIEGSGNEDFSGNTKEFTISYFID